MCGSLQIQKLKKLLELSHIKCMKNKNWQKVTNLKKKLKTQVKEAFLARDTRPQCQFLISLSVLFCLRYVFVQNVVMLLVELHIFLQLLLLLYSRICLYVLYIHCTHTSCRSRSSKLENKASNHIHNMANNNNNR